MDQSIEQALRAAAEGLTFQSETDQPFEAFTWSHQGELSAETVRALSGHREDVKLEETTVEEFFEIPTMDQDWHGPAEKAVVQKFRVLLKLIKEHLHDVKVIRVGETDVTNYMLGRTPQGNWVGLMTSSVET